MQAGDVLADRYRLDDLLAESGAGRFWRAHDQVLHRPVAVHILASDDERSGAVLDAARRAGPVINRRLLRILDAEIDGDLCYVVNEWGQGDSLDILLTREGPLAPRRAAWVVAEVADSMAEAHAAGLAHGCLTPENVLVDQHGQIRIIGFGVEAALRGLAPGRVNVDEIDLAGLLYCALTGKWAGVSRSAVPPAPEVHGEMLRPRRVRAGIPRMLDALCDQVLNPEHAPGTGRNDHTAARIAEMLHDYVGDMTGTHVPVPGVRPVVGPGAAVPTVAASPAGVPAREPSEEPTETTAAPAAAPEPEVETSFAAEDAPADQPTAQVPAAADPVAPELPPLVEPDAATPVTDLPTQAGMPVFHDDDEVDWLRARSEKPAPPPPLEEPEPKPLFAPDPPEGEPVRRPRPGSRAAMAAGSEYWPWDASQDSGVRPVGRDTGSWGSGSWPEDRWATGEGLDDTDTRVPGRRWIRLAMVVGILLLVGVAAVAAHQLGLTPPAIDPGSDEPTSSASPTAAEPTPFTDLVADDFDPQGDPQEENPDQAPLAVDGDPATSWNTLTYKQNFGPAGLKTGVGLVIDLGTTRAVRQLAVTTAGGQTSLAAYVTDSPPTGVQGLTPVGTASGTGDLTIDLDEAVSGRYVTVWLTLLPQIGPEEFRGTISEVQVLG